MFRSICPIKGLTSKEHTEKSVRGGGSVSYEIKKVVSNQKKIRSRNICTLVHHTWQNTVKNESHKTLSGYNTYSHQVRTITIDQKVNTEIFFFSDLTWDKDIDRLIYNRRLFTSPNRLGKSIYISHGLGRQRRFHSEEIEQVNITHEWDPRHVNSERKRD